MEKRERTKKKKKENKSKIEIDSHTMWNDLNPEAIDLEQSTCQNFYFKYNI